MVFKEISLDLIDDNPFQTRKNYDEDALAGIMATASDDLGLRNPPLVREVNGRYQIASGHSRVKAFKALKRKSILCRVEPISDAQMKKEVLVENVNRSDLTEDELWLAVEQYKEELGLKKGDKGFINDLSKVTGIPHSTLGDLYDVRDVRDFIKSSPEKLSEDPTKDMIRVTRGLEKKDRVKLLKKAQERGWDRTSTLRVKQAVKDMEPEIKQVILEKESTMSPKVIKAISELEGAEVQKEVITHIQTHGLDEKLAEEEVERIKKGSTIREVRVINEAKDVIDEFTSTERKVLTWGINHYGILGDSGWAKARLIFDRIEKRMQYLKQLRVE